MAKRKSTPRAAPKRRVQRTTDPINVEIQKVANGYVVSKWSNGTSTKKIAPTKAEARKIANQFLGI